ncbi:MAG: HAD-IIIC family phosphatase, partial [Bdellovibrionota bacterium]
MQKRDIANENLEDICRDASPTCSLLELHDLIHRLSLIKNTQASQMIRIAVGGKASLDYVKEALKFHLRLIGIEAEIYLCEFGTFKTQAFNPASALYQFRPDVIWHFTTIYDFSNNTEEELARLKSIWQAIKKHSSAFILQNNFDLPAVRVFGHFESEHGFSASVREANDRLAREKPNGVAIFDYDWLSCIYGKSAWAASRFWLFGKYPFAVDATSLVSHSAAKVIAALIGRAKKCLVLDFDNTLWGGVVADEGLEGIRLGPNDPVGEAFLQFQKYILALKERGIILAALSKNEASVAVNAFKHPFMLLKPEDFVAIFVDWSSKAENIRKISSRCGIGLDSMVFVDDNPFERELVRALCPEVTVPEMPEDPASFCQALDQGRYFEMAGFTAEDEKRSKMYRENSSRNRLREEITDHKHYLASLSMTIHAKYIGIGTAERAFQLLNKTNQFNLIGEKVSKSQIEAWGREGSAECRVYRLE